MGAGLPSKVIGSERLKRVGVSVLVGIGAALALAVVMIRLLVDAVAGNQYLEWLKGFVQKEVQRGFPAQQSR